MEILDTQAVHSSYLTMYERTYTHKGRTAKHFFVSRSKTGKGPAGVHTPDKKPDAVIIVAFHREDTGGTRTFTEPRLVLTDEFRVPIGTREISFPAGIIEDEPAQVAAVREMFEETGLQFTPNVVSPVLYSSAGMTDESCCVVVGKATGVPSSEHLEAGEDIHTMLLTHSDVCKLLERKDVVFSKVAWPFLWSFKLNGFPHLWP